MVALSTEKSQILRVRQGLAGLESLKRCSYNWTNIYILNIAQKIKKNQKNTLFQSINNNELKQNTWIVSFDFMKYGMVESDEQAVFFYQFGWIK